MSNRRLDERELGVANELLGRIRAELTQLSGDDKELLFALRRKVAKELVYDERSKPMARRALKNKMRKIQGDLCPLCKQPLPPKDCVLDRFNAVDGYVESNVRLICRPCDMRVQEERGYA